MDEMHAVVENEFLSSLMLGEPDVPAAPGDRVVWRESGYEVRTAHPIYLGERLSHWWAVLAPWGKEET